MATPEELAEEAFTDMGPAEPTGGANPGKVAAMQKLGNTLKAGDWEKAADAFQAAYDECVAAHSEGTEE